MATLIETKATASTTDTTTVTVTLNAAPAAGDKLIAVVGHSDDYPAVPSGWTQDHSHAVTGVVRIFSKTATGSEGTGFTFTAPTAGGMAARVLRYSGLGALHNVSSAASRATGEVRFGAIATTVQPTLQIAAASYHGSSLPTAGFTWNSGFTAVAADAGSTGGTKREYLGVASKEVTSTGNVTGIIASYTAGTTATEGVIAAYLLSSGGLGLTISPNPASTATSTAVTLTATASGGSGTKTYAWSVVSGPNLSAAQFSPATSNVTQFTPTAAGTYLLRCIVSDSSGAENSDVSVTVTTPSPTANLASVDTATSWTVTGTTALAALNDTDGSTLLTSVTDPSAQLLAVTFTAITPPAAGSPLTVLIDMDKVAASSGTAVAALYEGATLRSTVNIPSIPNGTLGSPVAGQVTVAFPAADIAAVTSWAALKLRLTVTAAT